MGSYNESAGIGGFGWVGGGVGGGNEEM